MTHFKFTALLLACSPCFGGIVINGALPSLLTHAAVHVPLDPLNQAIPTMQVWDYYEQSFLLTVSGGSGPGWISFNASLYATPFQGSPSSEYMGSAARIMGPFNIETTPYYPQGSSFNSCWHSIACSIPITFGVTEQITFVSESQDMYLYVPMVPSVQAYLQGYTIESWARIDGVGLVCCDAAGMMIPDAVVTIQAIPEPSMGALLAVALSAFVLRRLTK